MKIPELGALIEIRHARARNFQQRLAKGVDHAGVANLFLKTCDAAKKFRMILAIENAFNKFRNRALVSLIRLRPARVNFRLANRFYNVFLKARAD